MLDQVAKIVGTKALYIARECKVTAIGSPDEYYNALKRLIGVARENITMSALYLGSGKLEVDLIHTLEKALSDKSRPNLRVTVILDHSRALRGDVNSVTLLSKIIEEYPDRVFVYLYQMPQLRGSWFLQQLPGQLREVMGVYHCKFNVFDDCAILTGANLSNDYFTDRQDRYMMIDKDTRADRSLVNYLEGFTQLLSAHSYRVTTNAKLVEPREPLTTLASDIQRIQAESFGGQGGTTATAATAAAQLTRLYPVIQHGMVGIQEEKRALIGVINATANEGLCRGEENGKRKKGGPADTSSPARVKIATPYTSFKASLMHALISAPPAAHQQGTGSDVSGSGALVSIINPSAEAHGFAGATGVKSLVPKLHQCAFEQAIEDHDETRQQSSSSSSSSNSAVMGLLQWIVRSVLAHLSNLFSSGSIAKPTYVLPTIYEYSRSGWTLHTKGMWFYPPAPSGPSSSKAHLPKISYIGSSNFGARSWTRDFELGFVLATEEERVQRVLQQEYENIERWCDVQEQVKSSGSSSRSGGSRGGSVDERKKSGSDAFKLTPTDRLWLPTVTRIVKSFL